jgi:hypothetical protein
MIYYNGHEIEVVPTNEDFKFKVKKNGQLVYMSEQGWPFPIEAEVQAKLYVNRLTPTSGGWIIS